MLSLRHMSDTIVARLRCAILESELEARIPHSHNCIMSFPEWCLYFFCMSYNTSIKKCFTNSSKGDVLGFGQYPFPLSYSLRPSVIISLSSLRFCNIMVPDGISASNGTNSVNDPQQFWTLRRLGILKQVWPKNMAEKHELLNY